jgi:hypothetical protein
MAKSEMEFPVVFAGLENEIDAPKAALYLIGGDGAPDKKLGSIGGSTFRLDAAPPKGARVAIGPDVKDPKTINPDTLLRYRFDDVIDDWRERGILLPKDRWSLLLREIVCVSGRVRKCRPWWYDIFNLPLTGISTAARFQAIDRATDLTSALFPYWCVPLCDGIVEVWERKCCCHHPWVDVGSLLDKLRDLLERVPIEIDWPIPEPDPEPWGPLVDVGRVALNPQPLPPVARRALKSAKRTATAKVFDPAETYASERLFEDYRALVSMPRANAQAYIQARPYLYAYICNCTMKKVGQVAIQPDGEFDFCYWRPRQWHYHHHHCTTTHAYKVKQLINGVWTTVYDGVAGQDYYGQGERAEIRTTNPKARPCSAGPKPPHEGDGTPFVILQNVTGANTNHFNFPTQTDVSRVAPLSANSGLYSWGGLSATEDLRDCPWASTLSFRLWSSPLLKDIVVYYRLKVSRVDTNGQPVGGFQTLNNAVTWQRFDGTSKTTESLAVPSAEVGGEEGLYKFPYEGDGKNWFWVDYHQSWDTTALDGRFMLVLEVFGPGGVRIKPDGAAGPGAERAFQFRRWIDADDTSNVPFADCAHIFWVNNEPVVGDIVDLRKDGQPNSDECQFMSGDAATEFSVGFRAYHGKGVTTGGGPGDTNSFLRAYGLSWQRGLNGPSATLEVGRSDQGELAVEPSNSEDFGTMLGSHRKCTFSTTLNVYGKHHNGSTFLYGNDFHKTDTASFALEIG